MLLAATEAGFAEIVTFVATGLKETTLDGDLGQNSEMDCIC